MQLLMQASQLQDHPAAGLESAREAVSYRFLKHTCTLNQSQALNPPTGVYLKRQPVEYVCRSVRETRGETS